MAKVTRQRVTKFSGAAGMKNRLSRDVGVSKNLKARGDKRESFVDKIKAIEAPSGGVKMALYGRSGSGKTTFAVTFPKKLLLVRVGSDDGTRSVYDVKGVDITPMVKKPEHLDEIITEQKASNRWATIVLDTASEFQNVVLQTVVGLDSAPTQLSWGIARREQWGDVGVGVKNRLRDLLDLADSQGTNIIIVAQERSLGDEDSNSELHAPTVAEALTPSVIGWLNPACDYVCHTFIRAQTRKTVKKLKSKTISRVVPTGSYEYCLRTGIHDVYTIKFKKPKGIVIPDILVDPDYKKFGELLKAK